MKESSYYGKNAIGYFKGFVDNPLNVISRFLPRKKTESECNFENKQFECKTHKANDITHFHATNKKKDSFTLEFFGDNSNNNKDDYLNEYFKNGYNTNISIAGGGGINLMGDIINPSINNSTNSNVLFCKHCLNNYVYNNNDDNNIYIDDGDDNDNDINYYDEYNANNNDIFMKLKQLPLYLASEYNKIKMIYHKYHFNKVYLENFLNQKDEILNKAKTKFDETLSKIRESLTKFTEFITTMVDNVYNEIYNNYNEELSKFIKNVDYITDNISNIYKFTSKYDNLPNKKVIIDILNNINTTQQLENYIKNEMNIIQRMYENIYDLGSTYNVKYQYALRLLKKVYKQSKSIIPDLPSNLKRIIEQFGEIDHNDVDQKIINPNIHDAHDNNNNDGNDESKEDNDIDSNSDNDSDSDSNNDTNSIKNKVDYGFVNKIKRYFTEFDELYNEVLRKKNLKFNSQIKEFCVEYPIEDLYSKLNFNIDSLQIDIFDYYYPNTQENAKNIYFYHHITKTFDTISIPDLDLHFDMINKKSIENLMNYDIPQFKRVTLSPEINIPRLAKTIITPTGDVYFIGGDKSNETICFKPYMNTSENIEIKAQMHLKKYGHGLVMIGSDFIYSIAGYDSSYKKNGQTNECELFDIKNNKWTQISACNVKANEPSVCSFREKYIFKFGGYKNDQGEHLDIVERLSIQDDIWEIMKIKWPSSYVLNDQRFLGSKIEQMDIARILPRASSYQINEYEIMILGGIDQNFLYTDQVLLMRIHEALETNEEIIENWEPNTSYLSPSWPSPTSSLSSRTTTPGRIIKKNKMKIEITKEDSVALPFNDSLIQSGFIHNNRLYCLLIKAENDDFTKHILTYDNKKWTILL